MLESASGKVTLRQCVDWISSLQRFWISTYLLFTWTSLTPPHNRKPDIFCSITGLCSLVCAIISMFYCNLPWCFIKMSGKCKNVSTDTSCSTIETRIKTTRCAESRESLILYRNPRWTEAGGLDVQLWRVSTKLKNIWEILEIDRSDCQLHGCV